MSYVFKINDQTTEQRLQSTMDSSDLIELDPHTVHILYQQKGYVIECVSEAEGNNQYVLRYNGMEYTVQIEDDVLQTVNALGMMEALEKKGGDVMAPMPGKVLEILVNPGDTVEAGSPLMILEAMKMENVLKAAAPGTIGDIAVGPEQTVNKGDLLIKIS